MRRGGRRRRHQRNRSPLPAPDDEDVDGDKDDEDDDEHDGGDNGVLGHHLRQFLPQLLTELAQVLVKEYN